MQVSTPLFSFDELTVPQTIGRVLKIVSSQWLNFLQLGLATIAPVFFVSLGGMFALWTIVINGLKEMNKDQEDSDFDDVTAVVMESIIGVGLILLVTLVLTVVTSIVGYAAMIRATAELYAKNRMPDASLSLQKALWQFCELFLAGILMQILMQMLVVFPVLCILHKLIPLGVLLALVVPFLAVYMNIRFTLVYPAIVVEENCTATGALKRSWELTRGAFCDIWCAKFAFGAIFCLVLWANMYLVALSEEHKIGKVSIFLFILMTALPGFFFTPCSAVLQTVLYMNRRIRVEGLTQGTLAQDLVDRRAAGSITEPLLTVTEAHAEVDTNHLLMSNSDETLEATKVEISPRANAEQV